MLSSSAKGTPKKSAAMRTKAQDKIRKGGAVYHGITDKSTHIREDSTLLQVRAIENAVWESIVNIGKVRFEEEEWSEFALFGFKNKVVTIVERRPRRRAIFKDVSNERAVNG